jgi:hypothetical protein
MTGADPRSPFRRTGAALARFAADEGATLSVELVLMLPLLALWLAASFVFFDAFRVNMVNEKAAYTIADMISRQTEVTTEFINGSNEIFDFLINRRGRTWLRATSVRYHAPDPDAGTDEWYEVRWSVATRGREAFNAEAFNDLGIKDYIPIMSDQETVIITETFTGYTAPFNPFLVVPSAISDDNLQMPFPSTFNFNSFIVTRPRFVREIALVDAGA